MTHTLDASCMVCGAARAAMRPGYDHPICARCAVPEPQGALIGGNPSIATPGAEPWHWRPFRHVRGEDGLVTWDQPAPPTHVRGTPPKLRSGGSSVTPLGLRRAADELAAAGCTLAEREVILLQVQGLSREQIATRLGIGVESVKDRLKRARQRMQGAPA